MLDVSSLRKWISCEVKIGEFPSLEITPIKPYRPTKSHTPIIKHASRPIEHQGLLSVKYHAQTYCTSEATHRSHIPLLTPSEWTSAHCMHQEHAKALARNFHNSTISCNYATNPASMLCPKKKGQALVAHKSPTSIEKWHRRCMSQRPRNAYSRNLAQISKSNPEWYLRKLSSRP
jgi:hypothetical protein